MVYAAYLLRYTARSLYQVSFLGSYVYGNVAHAQILNST